MVIGFLAWNGESVNFSAGNKQHSALSSHPGWAERGHLSTLMLFTPPPGSKASRHPAYSLESDGRNWREPGQPTGWSAPGLSWPHGVPCNFIYNFHFAVYDSLEFLSLVSVTRPSKSSVHLVSSTLSLVADCLYPLTPSPPSALSLTWHKTMYPNMTVPLRNGMCALEVEHPAPLFNIHPSAPHLRGWCASITPPIPPAH